MANSNEETMVCYCTSNPSLRKPKSNNSMLMEWMHPSIEKRIIEVIGICETENEELFQSFDEVFDLIKQSTPDHLMGELLKLEEYFTKKLLVAETAYRIGFKDGLFCAGF